jgi:hypothetical protein
MGKHFTQVPNDLIRDESISIKARGILVLILSNREGWTTYQSQMQKICRLGPLALRSGMKELEKAGYLARMVYRDKQTKEILGSFLACADTPFQFQIGECQEDLMSQGFVIGLHPKSQARLGCDLKIGYQSLGNQSIGDQPLRILTNKNINIERRLSLKERDSFESHGKSLPEQPSQSFPNLEEPSGIDSSPPLREAKPLSLRDQEIPPQNEDSFPLRDSSTSGTQPEASKEVPQEESPKAKDPVKVAGKHLMANGGQGFYALLKMILDRPIKQEFWKHAVPLGKMVINDKISEDRIFGVIAWLFEHHGQEFVPTVFSGSDLRNKFARIEHQMKSQVKRNLPHSKDAKVTYEEKMSYVKDEVLYENGRTYGPEDYPDGKIARDGFGRAIRPDLLCGESLRPTGRGVNNGQVRNTS